MKRKKKKLVKPLIEINVHAGGIVRVDENAKLVSLNILGGTACFDTIHKPRVQVISKEVEKLIDTTRRVL
jgi:hypothetical protein